ncbi:hypothetical protein MTO96_034810 [Rhipicephalus appendiculatus]
MHSAIRALLGKVLGVVDPARQLRPSVHDISNEENKRALLLTLCGADTFETACALVALKTPREVHGINHVEHPADEITEVISRHPDRFREDIDNYTGPLIHLELGEDASPKFCKARPVPLAHAGAYGR